MREICIQTLLNQEKAQWRRRLEWCVSYINQGQARSTSNHRRLEEARNGLSLRASTRNQAFQQLHCWLLASKTVRWYIFRCFKLPALFVYLVKATIGNYYKYVHAFLSQMLVWGIILRVSLKSKKKKKKKKMGAPGWPSRLSIRLWLRSWSHGLWVRALRRALCWQVGSLEPASDSVSPSLSLPLPGSSSIFPSLSQK